MLSYFRILAGFKALQIWVTIRYFLVSSNLQVHLQLQTAANVTEWYPNKIAFCSRRAHLVFQMRPNSAIHEWTVPRALFLVWERGKKKVGHLLRPKTVNGKDTCEWNEPSVTSGLHWGPAECWFFFSCKHLLIITNKTCKHNITVKLH